VKGFNLGLFRDDFLIEYRVDDFSFFLKKRNKNSRRFDVRFFSCLDITGKQSRGICSVQLPGCSSPLHDGAAPGMRQWVGSLIV